MRAPLDRIDVGILQALQNDGGLSYKELADKVGLAPSSVLARVRRLREEGVLGPLRAEVDPQALGVGLQAIVVVRLGRFDQASIEAFEAHLRALPEVVQSFTIGGEEDLLVHVAVRDADHLRALVVGAISPRPEVLRTRTEVIFDHVRRPVLPVYLDEEPPPAGRWSTTRSRR